MIHKSALLFKAFCNSFSNALVVSFTSLCSLISKARSIRAIHLLASLSTIKK
ncbi:hypothetical protein HPCPY6261_1087 [Helicobacter pylori CPY6261]|nr:hypothetical protein HPCPY6261_1087 [Helicobacter pylori CPY6261]